MSSDKDFPYPLDTFVEEEVPVKKVRYDPDTNKVTSVTQLEKVKTMYVDPPVEKLRCKTGQHIFRIINGSKGLFACTKCPFHRKVYPTTYMFIDGRLIHKVTKQAI